ncbi:dTDP-4-dehydrorhamnose reductase [Propionivibrio sp.]|uniref:dTDP-4-dehydrorhamnose reductase n=1 Tax=Propionivibrio sp. TaxID=2212460 RepID=UPI0025ECC58D|nr:dTDP-4-dehydrorhamnose reductase [Propionivibrio sp.]MBK7354925.1 dTDP-4-dehydrorhamnose reductase [Propionivibrio sp.]MBK8402294.1 dTDP-4-dehydrorhamnose reductase [Propionivibrio sp.]MBK8743452.1 dTDP-4-dehydrorhamnose reductase [Propionivibrio sp.]MBK8892755.1 dTDP-4-dehydrorhamnose reductase [Propionivibrio sp.]MBL0206591.1 dTDP-4-dehydrorhamnose reductase [Propionivibrio sp.]
MKILLFGKHGQIGWELQRSLAPLGQVIALDREGDGGLCGDLTNRAGLAGTIRRLKPDVIVNAAAYTAVDKAELEPELAQRINGFAPGILADEAQELGAWLVHYSSDYVFDGRGEKPWQESDVTGPLSIYGKSKLQGELAVARCSKHLIFRSSWVYAARGQNFAKTMLQLAFERDHLRVINDQIGAPTGAELVADVTAHALRAVQESPQLGGLYHLAAEGNTSWHGYAQYVIEQARRAEQPVRVAREAIVAIPSSDYPTPAQRPFNSRLDTRKLQTAFGLSLPDWQMGVDRVLAEMFERDVFK